MISRFEDDYENLPQCDKVYGDTTSLDSEHDEGIIPLVDTDDNIDPGVLDKYLGARVILNDEKNDRDNIATVKLRVTDLNGRPIGTTNKILYWMTESMKSSSRMEQLIGSLPIRLMRIFTHN